MPSQSRRLLRGRRLHGRTGWWVLAAVAVLALTLGWAGWQAWQGARALETASEGLRAARNDLATARPLPVLRQAAERTSVARGRFGDPVVRALAAAPLLGRPLKSATGVAEAADVAVRRALLPLAAAAGDQPADRLVRGPGTVDVDYVAALAAPAEQAAQSLARATEVLEAAPADTWLPAVDRARGDFESDLSRLRGAVDDLAVALDVAPELLGQDGTRRYLVVSQSPAEARGTGGLIGGFSLLEVSAGTLKVVRSGPRSELQSPGKPVVDLDPEFEGHYGHNGPTSGWINSNLSPHFPYAARIWMELWKRQYGERLDGAVLLDPVALSYLLQATGPVPLSDGTRVEAGNVVDLTMRDVYARFDDDPSRDAYLQEISTGVAAALTTREVDGRALVEALNRAVLERRLLLWSAEEKVQSALADQPISGALPEGRRAVGDVIVDAAGSKLDYYLERDLRYQPGCGDAPSRLVLTLTNAAPTQGLPDYVTPAALRNGEPAGTNRVLTTLYLPSGSLLTSLRIDGTDIAPRQGTELGLPWVEVLLSLPPGGSKKIAATFTEPAGSDGRVERIAQPLVRTETFSAADC